MTTLEKNYNEEMVPKLMKELAIANRMAVPRLLKIVINCGLGEALKDKKIADKVSEQLGLITGQKPVVTKAKIAISSFKLRENDIIGVKVTLRGKRMYDFLMRLVGIALPRVRDFRGIPTKGFDGNGNYTLGIPEQTIFPDLEYAVVDHVRGFEATFVTSAETDEQAKLLLKLLGLPFAV
jgi:large subunit ribosomal protein L5